MITICDFPCLFLRSKDNGERQIHLMTRVIHVMSMAKKVIKSGMTQFMIILLSDRCSRSNCDCQSRTACIEMDHCVSHIYS